MSVPTQAEQAARLAVDLMMADPDVPLPLAVKVALVVVKQSVRCHPSGLTFCGNCGAVTAWAEGSTN